MKNTTSSILIADIETNGLLDEMDRIHCGVIKDLFTGTVVRYGPQDMAEFVGRINNQVVVGHNFISFDIPALSKFYCARPKMVIDTLVMSRVLNPDRERPAGLPQRVGPHSLEAWGYRLGFYKGDYGKQENAWDEYNEEMLAYCEQDVELNDRVYRALLEEMK